MNFKIAKLLMEIRNVTVKYRQTVQVFNYNLDIKIYHPDIAKVWSIQSEFKEEIENYFPYDGEFCAWLNHKVENLEFEKAIQRYLDLKAFI